LLGILSPTFISLARLCEVFETNADCALRR
jgi:hypothetical protein